jgi:hypothetical protein
MFHPHTEAFTRLFTGIALGAVGIASIAWPRCFAGVAGFFVGCSSPNLAPADRERLSRVIAAREDAEGISSAYGRYLGVAAIACAALEAVWVIPFIVPYALFCLAGAGVMLLAYLQYRRAAEQRVAPLVRRSPFVALPPLVIGAIGCSFLASLALAAYPPERIGALAVAVATIALGLIAWRVAVAPALLVGADPQWEYAVDERVRIGRARSIANLACAPTFVLVALTQPTLPPQYASLGSIAFYVAAAAFVVSLAAAIIPLRQRIRPA